MYSHREADHVDGFDDIGGPVVALLVRLNFVDHHVVLLFTVGGNIEGREKNLTGVFHTC